MDNQYDGVINIYKEKGFTSHDVVAIVKRTLRTKAGHTGTLDPDATGVLPICLGKGTRISDYIAAETKEYTAQIVFGTATDTLDSSGTVISEKPVTVTEEEMRNAIYSFKGAYSQLPPMYSAIKINGKKLYELARQGVEVERKPRDITIYDIEILSMDFPNAAEIHVVCSKGTYIRSLCLDIGKRINSCAHMGNLVRTRTGNFVVKDSIALSELEKIAQEDRVSDILVSIGDALSALKKVVVSKEAAKFLYNGNKVFISFIKNSPPLIDNEKILVYDEQNTLVGIYTVFLDAGGYIKPSAMLKN